jgi:hypothetical protein
MLQKVTNLLKSNKLKVITCNSPQTFPAKTMWHITLQYDKGLELVQMKASRKIEMIKCVQFEQQYLVD